MNLGVQKGLFLWKNKTLIFVHFWAISLGTVANMTSKKYLGLWAAEGSLSVLPWNKNNVNLL